MADSPAAEQVAAAAQQFSGARSGKNETQAAAADQRVDLVEQGGQFLDFIDDHGLSLVGQRRALLGEDARIS